MKRLRLLLFTELPVLAILAFALVPWLWMVLSSLRPEADLTRAPLRLLPDALTLTHHIELLARTSFAENLRDSLIVAAREAGVAYLRRCVDVAVAMGADLVGGPLYGTPLVFAGRPPRPFDAAQRAERVARVVEGLREAGAYAHAKGVRLAVEPLNRFETDFCNTGRQAVDLVQRVASPAVGVMLDTFHMNMEENDMAEALRLAAPHLMHFQANENHRGYLGTGHIDWSALCRVLHEIRYQGVITLEPFRRTDHSLSVPLAQWKPPAYDEDDDLRHSANLLRGLLHAAARS